MGDAADYYDDLGERGRKSVRKRKRTRKPTKPQIIVRRFNRYARPPTANHIVEEELSLDDVFDVTFVTPGGALFHVSFREPYVTSGGERTALSVNLENGVLKILPSGSNLVYIQRDRR